MPTNRGLDRFREIWLTDFEYQGHDGGRPRPICLVAREYRTGYVFRIWEDELLARRMPPYPTGPDSLFVAFNAAAELSCHLALDWPFPTRILDLYAEFRWITSGLAKPPPIGSKQSRYGLLNALAWYDIDGLAAADKESMRLLAARGGPWTAAEREALLAYCETDVVALARLLPAMLPELDLVRAVAFRGRYMKAVARMEMAGVPVDVPTLDRLRANWEAIQDRLIADVDRKFHVFEGRTFKRDRFAAWLDQRGKSWPRLESGELALDKQTFREMARTDSDIALMHELRHSLSELRLRDLVIGPDGRNREGLGPWRAQTGRNQPSNSKFIFGPSCWIRGLIKPEPGRAIAYVDWSQQEFGIAAALSHDEAMMEAYRSGDPYLATGKLAGRIPPNGTEEEYKAERELFKACTLGVQYGMGEKSLALRIGLPTVYARRLLELHRRVYPRFWAWSDGAQDFAAMRLYLQATCGWRVRVGAEFNPRSYRNFPCQANGAEMLRLACCRITERGISIIAPVHDAVLVEGAIDEIEQVVAETQAEMAEASRLVLSGFELRSKSEIVKWPDRYMDKRGREFWDRVMALLPDGPGTESNQQPSMGSGVYTAV
jgi:hypothetical protein